ncbi:hypothetical protein IQ07DRAFT_685041 [Pyrenochaeta sp. DS3sAY3a]|nr:hypothetical protein IQ07DRAFT_685041 [Pyrenochaeta sp. DS3sAY3a]
MNRILLSASLFGLYSFSSALTYAVPGSAPSNAGIINSPAPIGVSFEFFAWPSYMKNVSSTMTCLSNLKDISGTWPPVRIGGTTQDRATYDATSPNDVTYTVADPKDAPASLTFGPSFIELAAQYAGEVTIGFNRRLNNLANTVAASLKAVSKIGSLHSIELGNEPNFFRSSDPIAEGAAWNPTADYASQVKWQTAVCGNTSKTNLISAGVYFGTSPMSIQGLTAKEGNANNYVKEYCSHNYPQSSGNYDLAKLMSHSGIANQIKPYAAEVAAAKSLSKQHIFGETNSATQGGGGISPTYGAALWILDYAMQTVYMGTRALYFHQGTVGNCQYCWWGRYSMGAPYFGAYFATMALSNADKLVPLDDRTTAYAAYAIYKNNQPIKVLLYNSDYYTSGTRTTQTFTLSGLTATTITAKRLTGASATSRIDQGVSPTVAGLKFTNGNCQKTGIEVIESTSVTNGQATFTVAASEALLVYLV